MGVSLKTVEYCITQGILQYLQTKINKIFHKQKNSAVIGLIHSKEYVYRINVSESIS